MKKTIWAIIGSEEKDGIIVISGPNGEPLPLITADQDISESMKKLAKNLAK